MVLHGTVTINGWLRALIIKDRLQSNLGPNSSCLQPTNPTPLRKRTAKKHIYLNSLWKIAISCCSPFPSSEVFFLHIHRNASATTKLVCFVHFLLFCLNRSPTCTEPMSDFHALPLHLSIRFSCESLKNADSCLTELPAVLKLVFFVKHMQNKSVL